MTVSVYITTILFIYIKVVYCQGDMFRPSLGHLQALRIQGYIDFLWKHIVGSQMLRKCVIKVQ